MTGRKKLFLSTVVRTCESGQFIGVFSTKKKAEDATKNEKNINTSFEDVKIQEIEIDKIYDYFEIDI